MELKTILIIVSSLLIGLMMGMVGGYLIGFESALNTYVDILNTLDIKIDTFNLNVNETKFIDYMIENQERIMNYD